jgi:hypothetical protein
VFSFLHAPSRFGLVVALALSVLAGIALTALRARVSRPTLVGTVLAIAAAAELVVPLRFPDVEPVETVYRVLATLPRGAVLELPVYSPKFAFLRTQYMLSSTAHWMPLVDAYSDYIPQDFNDEAEILGGFPTEAAFKLLEPGRVRYAVFHIDRYSPGSRDELRGRLSALSTYLLQRYADTRVELYEILSYPP